MTRSNLYIKLSNGDNINSVADSSSAPEQGYFVEILLFPLLALNDAERELAFLTEHCAMNEQRVNADYRYFINLKTKEVSFFRESYDFKKDCFRKGENLTDRYNAYVSLIQKQTL
jgi:hypothetical protein